MEEKLDQLLNSAKKDLKALRFLKNAAVRCGLFETAAKINEIEKECFPETEEQKEAKQKAKDIRILLSLVNLNVDEPSCWLLHEAIKSFLELGKDLSIKDASKILAKKQELFIEV